MKARFLASPLPLRFLWTFLLFLLAPLMVQGLDTASAPAESRYKLQAWLITHDDEPEDERANITSRTQRKNPVPALLKKPGAKVKVLIELPLKLEERTEVDRTSPIRPVGHLPGVDPANFTTDVGDKLSATLAKAKGAFQVRDIDFSSSQIFEWTSIGGGAFWAPVKTISGIKSNVTLRMDHSLVLSGPSQTIVFRAIDAGE